MLMFMNLNTLIIFYYIHYIKALNNLSIHKNVLSYSMYDIYKIIIIYHYHIIMYYYHIIMYYYHNYFIILMLFLMHYFLV